LKTAALRPGDSENGTEQGLATRQFLSVAKARKGRGGNVPVDIDFKHQIFKDAKISSYDSNA